MARPVQTRSPAEHLIVLSRLARSIEIDLSRTQARRRRILTLVAELIRELQKDIPRPP